MGVIEAIGRCQMRVHTERLWMRDLRGNSLLKWEIGLQWPQHRRIWRVCDNQLDECVRVPDVLTDEEASLFEPCGVVHSVIKSDCQAAG